MELPMGIWLAALLGLSSALVCPDGGMCEDRDTCCQNPVGGYGCCPLPHAECCSDHLHCCYERTLCDLAHQRCVNKTVSLPMMRRLPAKHTLDVPQLFDRVKTIVCPDQASTCSDDSTCCELPNGSYGCCPMVKAVCCEDKLHCCPEGTECDLAHDMCVSASLESVPMAEKLPAVRRQKNPAAAALTVGSVTCPGGKSSCPESCTCCLLIGGDYGCCPYQQAVCCSDHLHCCPGNTTCDLEHDVCKSGDTEVPMLKKISAAPNDVVCPDKVAVCPDQTTCCEMDNGSYGCCPMPNAVCCSDHAHCCPEGTECDLEHSTCVSTRGDAAVASEIPAAETETELVVDRSRAVPCNDSVACADGNTCCETPTGQWACCPLPEAVCCDDHMHCCPHGTVCNLAASTCDDPSTNTAVMPWQDHVPVVPVVTDDSKCDKSTSCPGKSTCCKTASGDWACCPLPQAVCCDDHVHCCPHGTVCNLAAESCDDPSGSSASWTEKVPALRTELRPAPQERNTCGAGTSCPKDTTCCFMDRTRQWGCCPLPKAVCCSDGDHCCPSGHSCDPHRSSCSRGAHTVPWFTKLSAVTEPGAVTDVKCDDKSSCASGTTCCKLATGEWGCCPLVKAVCCADQEHCCPQGYTCNMQTGTCEKKNLRELIQTLPQTRVVRSGGGDSEDVPCDSTGEFHCPRRETCCKTSSTEWACCPSPKATCCSDSQHCCPEGFSCDAGGCTMKKPRLSWDLLSRDRHRDFVPRGL